MSNTTSGVIEGWFADENSVSSRCNKGDCVFVDTGGWYATIVRKDCDHKVAKQFLLGLLGNKSPLITSDYVMDETVTLLQSRPYVGHKFAVDFLNMLRSSQQVQLICLTPQDIEETIERFINRPGKKWSFTDCSSFILMEKHKIQVAFAFDKHFQQAGFQIKP